ncbi:MAG: MMPL family transporter, partial [Polyangiales bacterium]
MSPASPATVGRWHAYAAFLVAHRRSFWAFAIVVSIASALLASKLPLKADFANLLPPDAPSVLQLHAIEKRTSVPNIYLIGVEADDPQRRVATSDLLRQELAKIPQTLADEVIYDDSGPRRFGWNNRFLFASVDDLEAARNALDEKIQKQNPMFVSLFDDDDAPAPATSASAAAPPKAPLDELRSKLDDAKDHAEHPKVNVSKDGKLQLVLVRAGAGDTEDQLLDSINVAIATVRSKAGQGVNLGVTGGAVTGRAETKALLDGMLRSTVLTLVLVLAAMALFFRTVLGVGALGTSLIVGTLLTFGFTKLTVGQLNIASAFLSSIVIGNGINFGILLLARWLEEKRHGRVGVDALAVAMKGTAPGTIAAAVAAAAAYGSLVSTPFRGFRDFGLIGGVGMLLCWLSTYTLFPTLLF